MSDLSDIQKDIAASLYIKPTSLEELKKREFLKGMSEFGILTLLQMMQNKAWIYFKANKYYTYKSFAISKQMSEYELHGINEPLKRITFEKAINNYSN